MDSRRIVYIAAGGKYSNSILRAQSLARLGHEVQTIDVSQLIPKNVWLKRFHRATGYIALQKSAKRHINSVVRNTQYDLAWVDSGYLIGPKPLKVLKNSAKKVINYTTEDPTGIRDGNSWYSYLRAVRDYDLVVAVRSETVQELQALGAPKVMRELMSFDENQHRPLVMTEDKLREWSSEVVFIGSWMPERGPFIRELVRRRVPIVLYGENWRRARELGLESTLWRGKALYGDDYNYAIQGAKVNLGLLSKGNRDQHTTRSFEIPAVGGLLLAESTPEHLKLYQDGVHAVFWKSAEECAECCRWLLEDSKQRERIRVAGSQRVRELGVSNGEMIKRVLRCTLDSAIK